MTTRNLRDYRHFPPEYDELLRRFADAPGYTLTFPHERDARHTARDLSRYRETLRAASDAEPENAHVQAMAMICRDLIVRCFGNGDGWHVRLDLNPVVAAMRLAALSRPTDA